MTEAESYRARAEFVVELARRLHAYGTTTQRLEGAIDGVARRLRLKCEVWANPTGIILSFLDEQETGAETTRVLRLAPGDVDLSKLAAADDIAERVLAGQLGVGAGAAALRALDAPPSRFNHLLTNFCFGLTAGAVAVLLGTAWPDVVVATLVGWLVGALCLASAQRPRLAESVDALAALLATFLAFAISHYLVPLRVDSVVIAAIIVLMPGLTLTNAVSELTSQQLMAGTARFAGAVATLLKLAFGAVAAMQIGRALGWTVAAGSPALPPPVAVWIALLLSAYAFAVLFRADRRDYPLVIAAACLGYIATRLAGAAFGSEAGVFFSALLISAISNLYARTANRPGAIIRVPGIILLVPGSTGFRSLNFVFERDLNLGLDAAATVMTVLVSLVAGLMFGNLLVPPRRNL